MQGSSSSEPRTTPLWVRGIAMLLLLWGMYPFRVIIDHYPWKIDAIKWVTRSATTSRSWVDWVFFDTHFVGYRPVTALSFTLNHLLGGWSPYMFRLTDLGLHGVVCLLVVRLYEQLTEARNAFVLLPLLICVGHPAIEETLPYLPRRSYTLAAMFGLTGLSLWLDEAKRSKPGWRTVVATMSLVLALLSNEVAYVLLPMLPLLAWQSGEPLKQALTRFLAPVMAAVPCVLIRFEVIGWAGGYEKHYFAFTRDGRKVLREVETFNLPDIVGAAFDYVFFPVSFGGTDTIGRQFAALTFVLVAFYVYTIVLEPLIHWSDVRRRLPLLLGIWLAGYALLYGLSRTWFWRQAYPMVLVFALLFGVLAWQTWTLYAGRARVLRLIPQALMLVSVLYWSPMIHGMTTKSLWARFEGNEALHAIQTLVPDEGPYDIYLVLAYNRGSNRNIHTWLSRLYPKDYEFMHLATGKKGQADARVEGADLVLGPGTELSKSYAHKLSGDHIPLSKLKAREGHTAIVIPRKDGGWSWVELQ